MAKAGEQRENPIPATNGSRQMSELEILIRARYPVIYIISWEEGRVLKQVGKIAAQLNKKVFEWSVTTGLIPGDLPERQQKKDAATQDPLVALDNIIEFMEPSLFVLKDFHPYIREHNPAVIRRIREVGASLRNTYKTVIIVSPIMQLPAELEKEVSVIDFDLPTEQDFGGLITRIVDEVKDNPKLDVRDVPRLRESLVHSLMGMTLAEAENVLAKTLIEHHGFTPKGVEVVLSEKKQIIRKSGMLEYYDAKEDMNSVGGLEELKGWLIKRTVAFSEQARDFGLPSPKGILLLGVQGCGKSLMAKAISNIWKLPLLRFDVGKVFGSLVGSSEENIRRSIQVAESVSPVVFWVDEIDKAFRGSRGSGASTDGGTSARVFGTFLTWLAEKQKPVFVVATANDVSLLPPELLRKGRFDEIFFVDLPSATERKEIFRVHLVKRKFDVSRFDFEALSKASAGFSGAEIEEAIISAMFDVFYEKKQLDTEKILAGLQKTVPLSRTMSEDVEALREWARGRARAATDNQAKPEATGRKLEI